MAGESGCCDVKANAAKDGMDLETEVFHAQMRESMWRKCFHYCTAMKVQMLELSAMCYPYAEPYFPSFMIASDPRQVRAPFFPSPALDIAVLLANHLMAAQIPVFTISNDIAYLNEHLGMFESQLVSLQSASLALKDVQRWR
jgi:hypothetical protein